MAEAREKEAAAGGGDQERVDPLERQPYEKPEIVWEEPLEIRAALSMACGKSNPGIPICSGSISS